MTNITSKKGKRKRSVQARKLLCLVAVVVTLLSVEQVAFAAPAGTQPEAREWVLLTDVVQQQDDTTAAGGSRRTPSTPPPCIPVIPRKDALTMMETQGNRASSHTHRIRNKLHLLPISITFSDNIFDFTANLIESILTSYSGSPIVHAGEGQDEDGGHGGPLYMSPKHGTLYDEAAHPHQVCTGDGNQREDYGGMPPVVAFDGFCFTMKRMEDMKTTQNNLVKEKRINGGGGSIDSDQMPETAKLGSSRYYYFLKGKLEFFADTVEAGYALFHKQPSGAVHEVDPVTGERKKERSAKKRSRDGAKEDAVESRPGVQAGQQVKDKRTSPTFHGHVLKTHFTNDGSFGYTSEHVANPNVKQKRRHLTADGDASADFTKNRVAFTLSPWSFLMDADAQVFYGWDRYISRKMLCPNHANHRANNYVMDEIWWKRLPKSALPEGVEDPYNVSFSAVFQRESAKLVNTGMILINTADPGSVCLVREAMKKFVPRKGGDQTAIQKVLSASRGFCKVTTNKKSPPASSDETAPSSPPVEEKKLLFSHSVFRRDAVGAAVIQASQETVLIHHAHMSGSYKHDNLKTTLRVRGSQVKQELSSRSSTKSDEDKHSDGSVLLVGAPHTKNKGRVSLLHSGCFLYRPKTRRISSQDGSFEFRFNCDLGLPIAQTIFQLFRLGTAATNSAPDNTETTILTQWDEGIREFDLAVREQHGMNAKGEVITGKFRASGIRPGMGAPEKLAEDDAVEVGKLDVVEQLNAAERTVTDKRPSTPKKAERYSVEEQDADAMRQTTSSVANNHNADSSSALWFLVCMVVLIASYTAMRFMKHRRAG